MRIVYFLLILLQTLSCASKKEIKIETKHVEISRYFSILACNQNIKSCTGPVAKDIESANTRLEFEPYSKGTKGITAININKTTEEGIPFQSEIRITRNEGDTNYYVYMMIRSGSTLARPGKVKTFSLKSLSEFEPIVLKDDPINSNNGTLQAQLILGPKVIYSK